jgi:hypothetical protein
LRKRDFQKKTEDKVKDNRSSNGNTEDGPPAEPFNHPHPDDEKNESGGNKTEKINHQSIEDQDGDPEQGPEPRPSGPERSGRWILFPVPEDQCKGQENEDNRKPEREKTWSWMSPLAHGEMGGTPGRNDPNDQKDISRNAIPLINGNPPFLTKQQEMINSL